MRWLLITTCCIATQAQAQFLPPVEFDHPYQGRVVIQSADDGAEVLKLCPNMPFNIKPLGCTRLTAFMKLCTIVKVSDDQIRAAGHDPEVFMRHEMGHCNGWSGDHQGAR